MAMSAEAVSLEKAFESFGFTPAEAADLAAENRAANHGLRPSFLYAPDSMFEEDEEDEEEDELDLVDAAEHARLSGNFDMAEKILLMCLLRCMNDHGLAVVKLRIFVRLGDLYHERKNWKDGSGRFEEAYKMWEGVQWLADADRSIHPVAFLSKWTECEENLDHKEEAERLTKKAKDFEEKYSVYWDHRS